MRRFARPSSTRSARLASGDRSAFAPIYRALRPRAVRFASLWHSATASDVAQDALLKLFSRASDFTPGKPCLPWFYAIVANEIRGSRRRDARKVEGVDAAGRLFDQRDPETLLTARELERALETAIECLDQPSAAAIASILDRAPMPAVRPPTFRKRVSRAYAKLRLLLGVHDGR